MSCEIVEGATNPLLSVDIVDQLQQTFSGKVYFDKIYPIAFVGTQKVGTSLHKYPRVYLNDGNNNYIDVMPDSKLKGYTFFEIIGTESYNFEDDFLNITVSQICWFNMNKIDPRGYDYKHELLNDVLKTLKNSTFSNEITNVTIEENFENIYSKYTIPEDKIQYFMHPYTGFKLSWNMEVLADVDCTVDFEKIIEGSNDC